MLPTLGCSSGVPHEDLMEEKYAGRVVLVLSMIFIFFFTSVSVCKEHKKREKKYSSHFLGIIFVYVCVKNIEKEAPKTRLFTVKWVANSATSVNVAIHFSINYQFTLLNVVIKREKRKEEGGKTWEVYVYCQAFGFMFISWKVTPYIMIIDFTKYL